MKKKILFRQLMLMLAFLICSNSVYGNVINGIKYTSSDGEWTVVGPEEGYRDLDEYVILDYIDNCPVTKIAPFAFYNYDYKCTSITIPNTIREIGKYAFHSCKKLSTLTIPENVETLGGNILQYPENIKIYYNAIHADYVTDDTYTDRSFDISWGKGVVIIGNNVEHIPSHFLYLSSGHIVIPSNVKTIGNNAFGGKFDVIVRSTTPVTIEESSFPNRRNQTLYVPAGSFSLYAAADYWKEFGTIVENAAIVFEDPQVENICVSNWDDNGDGKLDRIEATYVSDLGTAFQGNAQITSFRELQYFTGLTSISDNAFSDCTNLQWVYLPNNVTAIGDNAFKNCSSLSTITLTENIATIGSSAFAGCSGLVSIPNLDKVTAIGESAFAGCTGMTEISFNATAVESNTFQGCTNLNSVTLGSKVADIKDGAFSNCTALESINIPGSVVTISGGFEGCTSLSNVTLNTGTKYIVNGVFTGCSSLTSITLPNGLVDIGESVFEGTGIYTIDIPSSVTSIGSRAFSDCSNLKQVTVNWLDPLIVSADAFPNRANQILIIPEDTHVAYKAANVWKDFKWIREAGAEGIEFADANAEYICVENWDLNMDGLLQAEEAAQVTDLGTAFQGNTEITSFDELQYFTSLTSLGRSTFQDCANLTSITLPTDLTAIGVHAFYRCTNLQSIVIPEGVTSLSSGVFAYCTSLTTIELPSSITEIQSEVVYGCTSLKSVKVNWTEPIAPNANAFPNRAHQVLYVPAGTKAVYQAADVWKDFLLIRETGASIPSISFADVRVKTICVANWDYDGDGELQTDEAAQVTDLGTAFQGNTEITSFNELRYFTGLTSIASNAFNGCTNLQSIVIPEGVTKLWPDAFYNCSSLTAIEIPGSVTEIMGSAFYGCSGLESVTVNWTTPIAPASNAFPDRAHQVLYVPAGTKAVYQSADVWKEFHFILYPGESLDNYAIYNAETTTLTFYHDGQALTRTGTGYLLNTGDDTPEWSVNSANVTTVVFDASFADARPTSTAHWFDGMSSLTAITGLGNLNTSEVTTMASMFKGCSTSRLTLDVSTFNTAKVTDMSNMFNRCGALTDLNLAGWNTAKVTDMSGMFELCYNLGIITVGAGWTVENVTSSENMFRVCSSLTGEKGTRYQEGNPTDKTYAHIDGGTDNPGYLTDINGPYAALSQDGKTLTFYSDGQRLTRTEKTYGLNAGYGQPGWVADGTNATIEHVVFDASFADARPVRTASWFSGMSNLSSFTGMENLNTSEVTNMSSMFNGCGMTSLDLIHFNTSKVTSMTSMFGNCTGLTTLDLLTFDTGNTTTMSYMFDGCTNLTTIYAGGGWNTEKVDAEYSEHMFRGCTSLVGDKGTAFDANHVDKEYARLDGGADSPGYFSGVPSYAALSEDGKTLTFYCDMQRDSRPGKTYDLNEPGDDPEWYSDIADITTVVFDPSFAGARPVSTSNWFFDISTLSNIIGIEYLNTSEVTNMSNMFYECEGLTSIDLSHFDTGKVTDMNSMFSFCKSLTSLDLSSFNTANVTDMSYMFANCSSLTTLAVGDLNTGKVTNMSSMFEGCESLTEIDFSGYGFMTTLVTDMSNMFQNCSSLTTINTWRLFAYSTSNVTNMEGMFNNCRSLKTLDLTRMKAENVTNMSYMFDGCTNLTEISLSKNFTASNVTNMAYMFRGCTSLKSLDMSSFSTENLENMNRMFMNCQSLKQLDLSSFNTDKVKNKNMEWAFAQCTSLESIDVSSFNTSGLTSLWSMFFNCGSLKVLDLSSFDTKKVTVTTTMFQNCSNLKAIYVGDGWDMSKVTTSPAMFDGCTNLEGSKNTAYDASHVDKTYAHIDGGPDYPGYLSEKGDPYAALSSDRKTLTFYCDGKRSSHTEATYDLNEPGDDPEWYSDIADITTVVFDVSFAIARPVATSSWFYEMEDLTRIVGMENLNTKDVTDMSSMFFDCMSLTSLDLSHFDTGKVTNMYGMFKACGQLKSLDLSSFATRQVTGMSSMFFNCYSLKTVYVKEDYYYWETSNVKISENMFFGCISIVGGGGTTYDANNIDKAYARIDTERSPGYFTEKVAFLLGDVNGDGQITIADVTALVNIILGKDTTGQYNHAAADVNQDNQITIADVTALVNIILGKN